MYLGVCDNIDDNYINEMKKVYKISGSIESCVDEVIKFVNGQYYTTNTFHFFDVRESFYLIYEKIKPHITINYVI